MVFKGQLSNGFFVEAGAYNGEEDSNSLYFEVVHNWTGLLVEPIQQNLMDKHRKAKVAPVCLSPTTRPEMANFNLKSALIDQDIGLKSMGGIVEDENQDTIKLQCFPLFSLLMAVGNPTIHYFILDIEGAEMQVLQTIPWTKVDIQVVSVETDLAGRVREGSRDAIIAFMKSVGYRHVMHRTSYSHITNMPKDDMFVREDVYVDNNVF
jgi:hypothetical protein